MLFLDRHNNTQMLDCSYSMLDVEGVGSPPETFMQPVSHVVHAERERVRERPTILRLWPATLSGMCDPIAPPGEISRAAAVQLASPGTVGKTR